MYNMDRKKIMPVIVMISVVLVIGLVGGVGTAQENTNQTDSEGVQLTPGESLDLVVDTVSSDVSESVDSAARERQLGEASNQSERARVLAQDLAQTERQSENISEEYKETVEKFKDGELSKKELIYEVSRLNSKATAVENSAENIRYASQFIPQDELGSNNITQERINNVSENVDIISNDVASNVRKMAITNSRSVNLTVQDGSMNVDVRDTKSGQSVYKGYNKDSDNRKGGVSNLNTTQALNVAESYLGVDRSQYDTKISKKGPHYDIKFVNNSSETQRVKVNGFDGSVLTSEIISSEDDEERSENRGDNETDQGNEGDRDNRGNGADNGENGADRGNSDNRGKPSATTSEVLEIIESNSDINTSEYEVEVQQYGAKFTAKLSNDNETQIISVNIRSGKIIEQSIDNVEDDERATYNISEEDVLNKVADEFDLNVSNYEVKIEKDDGNYEIELESENEEYEVLVDGNTGNILEYDSDVDRNDAESDDMDEQEEDEDENSDSEEGEDNREDADDNEEREDNEGEDDSEEESNMEEFDGEITSVDIQNNTITVNGDVIDVSNATIENDSEVKTYSEAVQLLNNGTVVLAEGEGEIATEMDSVDYIANTIEIESEDEEEDEDMERNNTEENNSTDNDGQERNPVR